MPNRITIYDEATNQYIRLDANNADYLNNRNAKNFDEARADIVRESIHSGLTTMIIPFSSTTNKDLTKSENRASIGSNLYSTSTPNSFQVANMVAYINGYKLNINDGTGNKAFEITLPSPPLDGANVDCLVFIEAYFPSNDTTGNMSYKIRSIQGIDFTTFPEGINHTTLVKARGNTSVDSGYTFTKSTTDMGLYIAGDSSQSAKTALGSSDGYSYAIPLFRVKRRNINCFNLDNVNGAKNFVYGLVLATSPTNYTITLSESDAAKFKVNDTILRLGNPSWSFKVISINGTTLTYLPTGSTTIISNNDSLYIKSDRPDSLFANMINQSDIIDLRHKVSLNGLNYQQLLESSFDSLLRGELSGIG